MSSLQRHGLLGRLWPVALTSAVLAAAAAGPSDALAAPAGKHPHEKAQITQQPNQVIDAKTNPDAAADALNSGTCDPNTCWKTDTDPGSCKPWPVPKDQYSDCVPADQNNTTHYAITSDWGPPSVLGDVLYNCSTNIGAETATSVKDEREETTSLSERVSLKLSLKLLGIVGESTEFSVFSKQSESVSTAVEVENAVAVRPGYKGWTVTQVKSGTVTGSAYVTDGVGKVIQIANLDMSFPGHTLNPNTKPARNIGVSIPMTSSETSRICNQPPVSCWDTCDTTPGSSAAASGRRVVGLASPRRAPVSATKFKLGLCRRSGRCTSRTVTGPLPPDIGRAAARLTRAGRTYGQGTHTRGHTQLQMRRPLNAGTYKLTLRERPAASRIRPGELSAIKTIVPITVG
jgi:hypothetical protein